MPPRRPRWGPWATLAWGLGIAAVMLVTQTAGAIAFVFWQRDAHPQQAIRMEEIASNGPALAMAFIVSTPFVLGCLALAARLARVSVADYLALKWPRAGQIFLGVVAVVLTLGLAGLGATLTQQESPDFVFNTYATAESADSLPLFFLAFVVLAPVQEELLFRGFLYRGFAPSLGPVATVVLLSAAWAALHVQYAWFFIGEIFLLGLTFGWLRWLSGSTLLTIVLHATVNGLAMLEAAFLTDGSA